VPLEAQGIKIAQATEESPIQHNAAQTGHAGAEAKIVGTHTSEGVAEEPKLGEIPSATLLFWNAVFVAILLIAFAAAATRKLREIPNTAQNLAEFIVDTMMNFTRGIIGPGGEKYTPLAGTLFFFILVSNLLGQIPGMHSPTANLSTTLALGLIVFIYVQYLGIRQNGIGGYLKHFAGPIWRISPLLFPIEVISELVKPFTLAMRLFGNIFGEDTVIVVLASLGIAIMPKLPILPVQFPILVLGLLTSFVQALVFTLLTCIYISLQSHHDEGHETHAHVEAAAH